MALGVDKQRESPIGKDLEDLQAAISKLSPIIKKQIPVTTAAAAFNANNGVEASLNRKKKDEITAAFGSLDPYCNDKTKKHPLVDLVIALRDADTALKPEKSSEIRSSIRINKDDGRIAESDRIKNCLKAFVNAVPTYIAQSYLFTEDADSQARKQEYLNNLEIIKNLAESLLKQHHTRWKSLDTTFKGVLQEAEELAPQNTPPEEKNESYVVDSYADQVARSRNASQDPTPGRK